MYREGRRVAEVVTEVKRYVVRRPVVYARSMQVYSPLLHPPTILMPVYYMDTTPYPCFMDTGRAAW